MRIKRIFPHDYVEYDDFLKTVRYLIDSSKVIFCVPECVTVGVESLSKLDTDEQQKRLISSSLLMDKMIGTNHQSLKLPVVLTLANFVANYYDKIKKLNDDELITLGLFYSVGNPLYIGETIDFISDKELLKSVMSKTIIYDEQMSILSCFEDKYFDLLSNNKNKQVLEDFKKETIVFIKNSSKDDLLKMTKTPQEIEIELAKQGY